MLIRIVQERVAFVIVMNYEKGSIWWMNPKKQIVILTNKTKQYLVIYIVIEKFTYHLSTYIFFLNTIYLLTVPTVYIYKFKREILTRNHTYVVNTITSDYFLIFPKEQSELK